MVINLQIYILKMEVAFSSRREHLTIWKL